MIGSLLIAGSLLGQWSIDDPKPVTRPAAEHPESISLPWKPIGPLPERIAPKPDTANVPKLTPDLPPVLPPVPVGVPVLTKAAPHQVSPALIDSARIEFTAMTDKPPSRKEMMQAFPPPKAEPAECVCDAGNCHCCPGCSCGGSHEAKPPVVMPEPQTGTTVPPLYQLTDKFGQVWTSPDPENLQGWVASRNALQPALWQPTIQAVQPQLYYRSTRPFFRIFGSRCAGGACQ